MIVEKVEQAPKNVVFIYTTCRDTEEARSIGLSAVDSKLAVSADFWAINSVYPWQGVIQDVEQYMLMLTTRADTSDALIKFVETIHSYTTPMIAKLGVATMNPTYEFWVGNTLEREGKILTEEEARARQEYLEEDGYHPGRLK
jgi:uncharacterized protein involved in tolerance to divalent cations